MLISGEYREQNAQCHNEYPEWGVGGTRWLKHVMREMHTLDCTTVLDYGCGKGQLLHSLADEGFMVTGYDPAIPEYENHGYVEGLHDYVACTDVLEHVEYEWIDSVLAEIAATARKGAFLVISLRIAQKLLPDGSNAHRIVENEAWWDNKLRTHFGDFNIDCDVYLTGKPRVPSTMLVYCRKPDGTKESTERRRSR